MSEEQPVAGAGGARPRPDISAEEVDALLDKAGVAAGRGKSTLPPGVAGAFDLVAADQAVRGRMPVLDRINERSAAELERRLAGLVRRPLEIELGGVELMPYAEWQARVQAPSGLNLYAVKPWSRTALLAIDGRVLFALVDAYYGGERPAEPRGRETLTAAEQRLDAVLAEAFVACFTAAFEPVAVLEMQHLRTETGVQHVAVATPTETVAVTRLELRVNGSSGPIDWVLPLAAFDSVREKLAEGPSSVSPESRAEWRRAFQGQLERTQLELAGVLLETELTVRELLRLRPGDILPVEMPETAALYAGSRPLLAGRFGQSRGYNAISVAAPAGERPAAARGDTA